MRDFVAGIFCAAFAGLFLILSLEIRDPGFDELGPRFLPQLALGAMLLLSLVLALQGWRDWRGSTVRSPTAASATALQLLGKPLAIMGLLVLITIALVTRIVPFEVSGIAFTLACGALLVDWSNRRQVHFLLVIGTILPLVVGFVFKTYFFTNLP